MSICWACCSGCVRREWDVTAPRGSDTTTSRRVATTDDMVALGAELARELRAGDLLVLSGDLGAGKTALTRGIGAGLGVRGPITSPTFVIARVHPSLGDGPALVHVDAYRIGSLSEIDDLDLDASLADSVTVVEWGRDRVESLSKERLEIDISVDADESREVILRGVGQRWADLRLA